ncbi:MAG: hypothetical protein IKV82_08045 [Akkermansia sp.]|nr:hypothetical protein [Akkermansia sp.]
MSEQPEMKPEETKKEDAPLETARPEETPAPTETPSEAAKSAPETETKDETTEKTKPAEPAKKGGWGGFVLDSFLVIALLGTLGGGGYYLKQELDKYRVPSLMEITMRENLELCMQRESLQTQAYHADEQIHMRKLLARLERQLGDFSRKIADKEADITEEHNRVLALQHEIRQADKEARSVARSLLPGMPVGNVTTTSGRAYRDAVIYRMEGKLITLRSPEGQVRFPANQLVKDSLPTLARYAFNKEDLVDMSDFEASPMDAAAARQRTGKRSQPAEKAPAAAPADAEKDYEAAPGAPVVDTEANRTTTNDAGDASAPQQEEVDPWQAPLGDLPL